MSDDKKDAAGTAADQAKRPTASASSRTGTADGAAAVKKAKPGGPRIHGWAENPDELASFLEEPNLCRVGTIDKNGFAHITPAWFHWDGAVFYVGADADDAKVANIRRTKTWPAPRRPPSRPRNRLSRRTPGRAGARWSSG